MQKLEINNIYLPLSSQVVTISKRAYEFTDLSVRNIDITNRINLDNTPEVREALQHPELINADNNAFETLFPAKLFDETILFSGVAEIQEVTKQRISLQLVDTSKDVFEQLKTGLNQLSVDQYDFTFGLTAYNALNTLTSSIWVWPICNMRLDKTGIPTIGSVTEAELKYSRPMMSVKQLLTMMFSEKGWTYDRTNTPLLNPLTLSVNHEAFYVSSYLKVFNETLAVSGSEYLSGLDTNDYENAEVTAASTSITIDGRKTSVRLRGTISADADFTISVEYGTKKQSFRISQPQTALDLETSDFDADTPQVVKINIVGDVNLALTDFRVYTLIEETEFGDLSTNQVVGFLVPAYDNMPDITQFNLFMNTLVLSNAFINTNSFSRTITAHRIGALDKFNSVDWSSKYISDSEEITNETLTLYQNSYLGYSNDGTLDVYKGAFRKAIDYERYEDTGFILQIKYSASGEIEDQGVPMADLPIYGQDADAVETRINELDLRLLYFDSGVASFNEIDFNTLAETQFKGLLNSLSRPRVIECQMELNKLDVLGFDFTKLVYVDRFKSYFYVLAIEDYEKGVLTVVRLMRV